MDAQQLAQVESLCTIFYTGTPATLPNTSETIERAEAQSRLLSYNPLRIIYRNVNTF